MPQGHDHGQAGQANEQQMLQVFQQKIGNLELTLNALIGVLVEEDLVDQDEINEKAQEIIQEIQDQQAQMQEQGAGDLADALEEEE